MEPRMPEEPGSPSLLRPRRVGEILTDAFRLYARHWQNLIVLVAVIVVPLSILQVLLSDLWIREGLTTEEVRGGVEVSTGTVVGGAFGALGVAQSLGLGAGDVQHVGLAGRLADIAQLAVGHAVGV